MSELAFTVLGRPQPAGSKRAFRHRHANRIVVVDDAKGSRPWKQQVAGAAAAAKPDDELLAGPLVVELVFVLARPKGHYGTGRNATTVRAGAPARPITKPDVDKLSRAVMDACTGVVWRDDAQVVDKRARKAYGSPERCEIRIATAELER
jgi:Holliday junction resolvase RusA-like endonuclease